MRTILLLLALLLAAAVAPAAAWWEWRPPFWVENGPNSWCGWFPRPPCPVSGLLCVLWEVLMHKKRGKCGWFWLKVSSPSPPPPPDVRGSAPAGRRPRLQLAGLI